MDNDHHVLDQDDLSDRMDHSEDARGTAGYAVARGVGRGMGVGHVVSYSDLVGACTFEAGKTTLPFEKCFSKLSRMALLDAVLDVVKKEYAKAEPKWTSSRVLPSDMEVLEKECAAPSDFDPFGWRKEVFEKYQRNNADVRECAYGRVVAMGEADVLAGIPWGLWGRILRQHKGKTKAKIFFLASPYLRTIPKNPRTPIGPPHINGGYTYHCNMETIVIYRAEDATRVLIHELQHASCLDHMKDGTDIIEAKTEAWAELLYAGLLSRGKKALFHELVQKQADWMSAQNAEVKKHIRGHQFPWRYTVGKEEVWEHWGIRSLEAHVHSVNPPTSLRLTPPPSDALKQAFGTDSNIL